MLDIIYGIMSFFGLIILFFMIIIMTQKTRHDRKSIKVKKARDYLFKKYIDQEDVDIPVSKRFFFDALIDVDEQIHLEPSVREHIINDFKETKFIKKQFKLINSKSVYKRKIAVYYISKLRTENAYELLFNRFLKEKNEAVKIRIVANMRYGLKDEYLTKIIESLVDSTDAYHERLCVLLGNNYKRLYDAFLAYKDDQRYQIVLGLIRIGAFHSDAFLIDYMQNTLSWVIHDHPYDDQTNLFLKEKILQNIFKHTPELLSTSEYLDHDDILIRSYGISSLYYEPCITCINKIIEGYDEGELEDIRVKTLSKIVLNDRSFLNHLLRIYQPLVDYQKEMLINVFSDRIDYIILDIFETNPDLLKDIIDRMIRQNNAEAIIDFLNNNRDKSIETYLLNIIKIHLSQNDEMTKEFRIYLNQDVLKKMGLQSYTPVVEKKEKAPVEKTKVFWMIRWMIFSLLLLPIIYLIRFNVSLFDLTLVEIIEGFLIDVNVYLIFYFTTINAIYMILFVLALINSRKQVNLSKTRKNTLLFSEKLLPGISIIAPAYNEEMNIIDSITSLLNLKYPIYEVIVVNDGSKDETLNIMIAHFKLERKHSSHINHLGTKKIRAVYYTKDIPNLIVVDKQNGGKADALNVGINLSKQPYVCGIDADSILEGNALLKLASTMLDDTKPYIAMGGNIYPANGFTFDKGRVEKRAIPSEMVCRFQTIEYLRAFTSGRIGWSQLRSLMIISGAFGLFHKQNLIDTGGYLTSSSKLKKDTVGEDMELVVRMTIQALEQKDPYRVAYVYNAHCYTELPSDLKTLLKQRNRWQRGLIDILSYHRKISFNPKYKQIGLIGYPYFFIFEFLGPFFEAQGYIMLTIALILGLLNPVIILGIFVSSILFGVVISLSSIFMSEKELKMMSRKDTIIMLIFAIIENFGYRQLISMHRVFSSFSALRENNKWGSQKRKGFKT
ncbi:MAG: glycosyltransferase family 2 protein [Acholeplasmataceae bacterium]|nr:glycosyltransferase family 2 protein [Acholeplasmataceae bacterium]